LDAYKIIGLDKLHIVADSVCMIITNHREKLINAIIYFAKNTNKCGKLKLLKLLYFLDFSHFKQTGKSVTGIQYFAWEMGPVPKKLFEELSGKMGSDLVKAIHALPKEGFQKIRPKKDFNDDCFSSRELRLLEELTFIFKDANADQMIESTHFRNEPWDKTIKERGEFQPIDYLLAVDDNGSSLSHDDAKDRMEERREMFTIFGVA
jgi:uncharacterized phage-associated protein